MDLLIVDGYNIIHADPGLKQLLEQELGLAREGLLKRLLTLVDQELYRVVVVFDSSGQGGGQPSLEKFGEIEVAFTAPGQSGDSFVEHLVQRLRKTARIVVATNDRQLQNVVSGYDAIIKSAETLLTETEEVAGQVRGEIEKMNRPGGMHRVDAQIDREIKGLLDEMRFNR